MPNYTISMRHLYNVLGESQRQARLRFIGDVADGRPRNFSSLHHIYIFPVNDTHLWNEAASHFTLVFQFIPDMPQHVRLILEGVGTRTSHITARPPSDPQITMVRPRSAPHFSCPSSWECFDTWLSSPKTFDCPNWPARVSSQWKQNFKMDFKHNQAHQGILNGFMGAVPVFVDTLSNLFQAASAYLLPEPVLDILPTPPLSPDTFLGQTAPGDRDLNAIPEISSLFGDAAMTSLRESERLASRPANAASTSQPDEPETDSNHDGL